MSKSNKKVKQMVKSILSHFYLDDEDCSVKIHWSRIMLPAIEDIRVCPYSFHEYHEYEIIDFGIVSIKASDV